jgi:DNA polymerase-4
MSGTVARRILHADADAFFVAVARLADPEGAGRAALLLVGGAARRRGVVTSASYETRAYGVRSGMPMAQALRLCPGALQVPVPHGACGRTSREIRRVLERFTPLVEAASIDEFYLDLTGTEHLYRGEPLEETAARIRRTVKELTGIVISVGGGTSRLVAKLASRRAKPTGPLGSTGVCIIPPGGEAAFLAELDLAAIPGIGPRFQERLATRGLVRVTDALRHDELTLRSWFGSRTGRWLYRRVRGIDTAAVVSRAPGRSLGHEETFATDLDQDDALAREVRRLAGQAAADLRARNLSARTVTVKLRDADFTTRRASRTLPEPVTADAPVIRTATTLLTRLRRARRTPARLVGVTLSQLAPASATQLSLFEGPPAPDHETERERTLASALDAINRTAGRRRILRASELEGSEP